ncbi:MAG: hypothetical protein AB8H03_19675 [Saprospiraceae bacterium]
MKKIELYLFVIVLFFIGSCDLKKEPIPAYIHIEPFTINSSSNEGTKEHQITDAWVSDAGTGDFLGVYELPATVPIIADGNTKLIIAPGILENGIRATPNIYSLMTSYEAEINLAPSVIDTIQPDTKYGSRVEFRYKQDFETTNPLNEILDTTILLETKTFIDPLAFEGSSVGFTLDEDNPRMEVAISDFMELETKGDLTVMEMHYKNEGILQVALLGYEDLNVTPVLTYFLALNPQSDWNKVYVNLTNQLVGYGSRFKHFKILFGAQLPEGETTSTYLIDNIKVLELPDD